MRKNIKKVILKQIVINSFIIMLSLMIYVGVSYSLKDESNTNKDLLIKTGNMQVILNVPSERYEFDDTSNMSLSDEKGVRQAGYNFSIKNTGNIPIEYYEIKLVNQENKISTLPFKYLRFIIKKDNEDFSSVRNLGDTDGIICSGYNLDVGQNVDFNLKIWLEETSNIFDKELYAAMEVTLYQKFDVYDNYVLYDSNGGVDTPVRTSIYNYITTFVPTKDGYIFKGWSSNKDGMVEYENGTPYKEKKGKTLYAVWENQK